MVLRVTCHLASHVHDSFCGSLTIPLKSAEESKFIDSWFLLAGTRKELNPVRGELHLRIKVCFTLPSVHISDVLVLMRISPCR